MPTDAHAIYLLNLLLAFLQPRFDPSLREDMAADEIEEGGEDRSALPSQRDDEFRPFVRRLPEYQFWCVPFSFIQCVPPCSMIMQAIFNASYSGCDALHYFRSFRRSRVLANLGCILLRPLRSNNETPNPVSFEECFNEHCTETEITDI